MTEDYLKQARTNGLASDSAHSEAELIQTRDDIRDAWEQLSEIRNEVFIEKRRVLDEVDAKFHDAIKDAEANYAMLLSLAR